MRGWTRRTMVLLWGAAAMAAHAAAEEGGPTTRGVRAQLEARRTQVRGERYCTGADGLYRFAHETYEGTSTGEEELTGRFVLEVQAVDNVTQGFLGLATGRAKIFDAESGRLKVAAEVLAVDSPSLDPLGVKVDGFVHGQVFRGSDAPATGAGAALLFANFSVRLDTSASFVGSLGADAPVAPQNVAVIQDRGRACAPVDPPR